MEKIIPVANMQIGNALNGAENTDAAKRRKLDLSSAKIELGYEPKFKLPEAIQVLHKAGVDLTEDLRQAPHNEDLLERVPLVALLAEDE